jgi:hypothetical protein
MNLFEQMILEFNDRQIDIKAIESFFQKTYLQKNKGSRIKPPEDLRFAISGDPGITYEILKQTISTFNLDYKIEPIGPEEGKEFKSGTFYTYKLYNSLNSIYIVDAFKQGQKASRKQFTPDALGFAGKIITKDNFANEVREKIRKSSTAKQEVKDYMNFLLDTIITDHQTDDNVEAGEIYKVSKDLMIEDQFDIDDATKKIIFNDFGEILVALFFAQLQNDDIEYPSASNEKLIDVKIGDINISVKQGKGAAPSLTGILESEHFLDFNVTDKEKDAFNTLNLIKDNSVFKGFLKLAEKYDIPAWSAMLDIIGPVNLNDKDAKIRAQMHSALDKLYYNDELNDVLDKFYKKIGNKADEIKYDPEGARKDKRFGYIMSPLSASLVREMNGKADVIETLNNIVRKIEVKQIYITNKKNHIEFKVKNFSSSKFVFSAGNISVNNPGNSKLAFKMK